MQAAISSLLRFSFPGRVTQHGEGAAETADVKVKLGEYQVCYQVVKGPADLRITSASGTDYTCSKKLPSNTPLK
jgi:hypothetical protein